MKHTYIVHGMHCGACAAKVTEALESVTQVQDAQVSRDPPRATVTMRSHASTDTLNAALARKGQYTLTDVAPQPQPDAPPSKQRSEAAESVSPTSAGLPDENDESLYPLILIVGFILGTVVLIEVFSEAPSWMRGMRHFMAGFFIVFGFFKLLDPPGFVSAFRGYDLLARRSMAWAWAYPYVELTLGVAYLGNLWPIATNATTLVLMLIGAAGVLRALLDKRAIRCACLGTALNLPMTKVTLVEDLTMAVMAGVMLLLHLW